MNFFLILVALSIVEKAVSVIKPIVKGVIKTKISKALRELCLPDVNLPDKSILKDKDLFQNLKSLTVTSSVDLIRFGAAALPITSKIKGKEKKNNAGGLLTDLHNFYINSVVEHKELLPDGYKFFGSNSNVDNLKLMLQNNPFYASALICKSGSSTFAVSSVETGNGPKSWYSMLVEALEDSYPRINAVFSSSMDLISFDVVDPSTGKAVKSTKTKEEAAGDLLYTLTFYTEAFHALIHVFHYINVVAIGEADSVYPMLSLWSKPYIANVALKYEEVEKALLPDTGGVLTGGTWRTKDPVLVKKVLREMLCKWGSCTTAAQFVDEFLFKTLPKGKVRKAGLLPEFFKHVDLIAPFAKELTATFESYDRTRYGQANRAVQTVLSNCGDGVSAIADIDNWVQLMSVTGIVHGSTLSLSRMLITEEMLKRVSDSTTYTDVDAQLAFTAAGTIVGMIPDRHVFSSSLCLETAASGRGGLPSSLPELIGVLFNPAALVKLLFTLKSLATPTPGLDPRAKEVLLKYDALSTKIKKDFYTTLSKDPKKFSSQGWILSDHFPDGIDGKQLTITTYI